MVLFTGYFHTVGQQKGCFGTVAVQWLCSGQVGERIFQVSLTKNVPLLQL